jgi:phage-related protein
MYQAKFAKYGEKVPFEDFLESMDEEARADIFAAIDKLLEIRNLNSPIPMKLSRYLKKGLFELRVKHYNKISRSLYFFVKNKKIVFTHGFIKKSEKTPKNEIEKGLKIMNYYLSGGSDGI